ncbi:TPA: hypothetical protein N0F65_009172 [Lagenidium giganteum]|uniref:Uncharacterized protein n=1 Tax=Lagenidium giganteum TaxID=4803 RepID=A0AAV2YRH3_9STRA|nr:TPA: hypothetical protein N0F65_009172 [Lagenidium giganteum]
MRAVLALAVACWLSLHSASVVAADITQDRTAWRRARSRDRGNDDGSTPIFEVGFSDSEEAVLKAQQGQDLSMISKMLNGRSVPEIQRRCVELGLRCGQGVEPPESGSERWRVKPKAPRAAKF